MSETILEKSLRTQTSSETPGRKLSKTARQLDPKHREKTLRKRERKRQRQKERQREREIRLVASKREKKRREEDCCAGAILDFICLLGDGPPALKSPLGARIV